MTALLAIFGGSFLISLSGALMPGPLFTLSVRETLRRGFWVGPLVATGHAMIELVMVIALALGLNEFLGEGKGTATIAIVGGLFLLWMGYHMLRTAPRQELNMTQPVDAGSPAAAAGERPGGSYRQRLFGAMAGTDVVSAGSGPLSMMSLLVPAGAIVSVANPYWIIWWATIGMAYMSESLDHGVAGVGSFFTAHILSDFVWLSLVAFALVTGRRLMSQRAYRGILLACGFFLLLLGARFIYSGVDFLT
ncbi:MAG: LysE family transporter [Dehalococcoidia bacterium]